MSAVFWRAARVTELVSGIIGSESAFRLSCALIQYTSFPTPLIAGTDRFMALEDIPENIDGTPGFVEEYAGQLAECDGGGPVGDGKFSGRQDFRGRLTGDCVDVGDPPARWYLMVDLIDPPDGYEGRSIWCLAGNTFLGEDGPRLRGCPTD